jgi:hypothetical protein
MKLMRHTWALAFFLLTTPCFGAINHIQQASNSVWTNQLRSSSAVSFSSSTTAGNAIIVSLTYGAANPTITATDSQGNTFQEAIQTYDSANPDLQGVAIFYATNIKGGADTITISYAQSVAWVVVAVHEYSGLASVLDVSAGSVGNSTSPSSGSATTTANGDLIFGTMVATNGTFTTLTGGSGFTKRMDLASSAGFIDEDQIQSSAGSIAATWAVSPAINWAAAMAAFKASNGTEPRINGLSPIQGPGGTAITITGTNFGATQGTSTVTFNGTTASPTSWSATSIVVPVPNGATSGNLVVRVSGVPSNSVSFTPLPTGWADADIGSVGPVGSAGDSNGTFTVLAGGSGVGNWEDSLHFAYQTLSGDGAIVARIVSIQGGRTVESAGVMIRETLSQSSQEIYANYTSPNSYLTYRVSGGSATETSGGSATLPCWVKVVRNGNTFTGYTSSDGTNWVQIGASQTVNMGQSVYIGLGVASGSNTAPSDFATATFDNVSVTAGAGTGPNLSGLSPTWGSIGQSVTITGKNLGTTQGTSTVKFNGVAATPTSWSATSVMVPVPTGATTGNVVVTVSGGASNGLNFTVVSPPPSGISHVQQASNSDASSQSHTSFAATFASNTGAGNAIILSVSFGGPKPTITATDNQGNTYLSAVQTYDAARQHGSAIFYALNIKASTADTVTVDFSSPVASLTLTIHEYTGLASSGLDVATGQSGVGASPWSGAITPTTAGDLIFSSVVEDTVGSGDTFTVGTGFTKRADLGSAVGYADEDEVQPSAGAITGNWILAPSGLRWVANVAAFKSSNGTGSTGPVISSVSPTSGPVGTVVTITGSHFGATQGSSTLQFGSTSAAPTSWSDTQIIAKVPSAAPTGSEPIGITVGGLSSSTQFQVGGTPTIRHIQQASNSVWTSQWRSSSTVSFSSPTTAGNAIIVSLTYGAANPTITATDSQGNTYQEAIQKYDSVNPDLQGVAIFYATNIKGGADTITISYAQSVAWVVVAVHEYSGLASVLDVNAGTVGNGTNPSSGSATTTANGDLIFGAMVVTNGIGSTFTGGPGFTKRMDLGSSTGFVDEDQIQSSAGAIAATWTVSPSVNWAAAMAAFKASTSGTGAGPGIATVSPGSGTVGTVVTITGTNFGTTKGTSTVQFGSTVATPTSWSNTQIVVPVPSGTPAGTQNLAVTVNGLTATFNFQVGVTPVISSVSPSSAPIGTAVTITGTNFGAAQGTSTITVNGRAATPASWSTTSIVVPVPAGATTGNIVVTVGGIASSGTAFTVLGTPSITNLSVTSGAAGTSVTITGTSFGTTQGTSTVTFNGTTASPTSWSTTSIVAPVPAGATTGNVVVTVAGVAGNGAPFTVSPHITSLSPNSGGVGAAVTITGTTFGTTQGTVQFNGTTGTPAAWGNTSITVPVPAGATSGNVTVTVAGVTSNGATFTVLPTPSITSLSPTSGAPGASVTVTGTNFGASQGSSAITFNGTAATATSWSATRIVAVVPTGASTGSVVVTVSGVASNGVSFVVGSAPAITSVAPTSGPVGTSVTVNGANFGATQGSGSVKFNGTVASPTSWSNTSVVAPVPSGATTGNIVVTASGAPSNGIAFTVLPTPSITSLSPTSGPTGTSVTITGTNFGGTQGTSTVAFNGAAATPTSWSATSIVVPVPQAGTIGNVIVTVSGVNSNGISFTVTPTITSLSPTSGGVGSSVTITGTGFGATQGTSTVTFNGTTATTTSWSTSSIVATVPTGTTTGNVVVTVAGNASNGSSFSLAAQKPSITSLSLNNGPVAMGFVINGSGFGTSQGSSVVKFNSVGIPPANIQWGTDGKTITVQVPTTTANGDVIVTVTVNNVDSNGVHFTVVSSFCDKAAGCSF